MILHKDTQPLAIATDVKGGKIFVYDVYFNFPNNATSTFWVAQHENGTDGFIIDGKRLCFKHAWEQVWDDVNSDNDNWLQTLRDKWMEENKIWKPIN